MGVDEVTKHTHIYKVPYTMYFDISKYTHGILEKTLSSPRLVHVPRSRVLNFSTTVLIMIVNTWFVLLIVHFFLHIEYV